MKTIYKYLIEIEDTQTIEMPKGAKILSIQLQGYMMTLWAQVDTEQPMEPFKLFIFGTGHELPSYINELHYLSTVQQGSFVWHIYLGISLHEYSLL